MDIENILYMYEVYFKKSEEELEELYFCSLSGIENAVDNFGELPHEQKALVLLEFDTGIPFTKMLGRYLNWKKLSEKYNHDLSKEELSNLQHEFSAKYSNEVKRFYKNKHKAEELQHHAKIAIRFANLKKYEPFLERILRSGKENSVLKEPMKWLLEELAHELEEFTSCELNEDNRSLSNLYKIYLNALESLQKETKLDLNDTRYLSRMLQVETEIQNYPQHLQNIKDILCQINESILFLSCEYTPNFCDALLICIENMKYDKQETLKM